MFKYLLPTVIVSLWGLSEGQKEATLSCQAVTGSPTLVRVVFRIQKNGSPINTVYAFNAANGDTTLSANRINDCLRNGTVDPVEFIVNVDITAGSHSCGAAVTDAGIYKKVSLLFRAYASSDTILTAADSSYSVACRSDQIDDSQITLEELNASGQKYNITVQSPQIGAYLRLRNPDTLRPLSAVSVGEKVILSVEFTPSLDMGPDLYGTHFFVGFLRNEPITGTSSLKLYVQIIPRYAVRTDITITTAQGSQSYNVSDKSPLKVSFDSTFMGNSADGKLSIDTLGIEIYTFDREVSVVVCNQETGSSGCYSALPVDVTGTEYYTVSMPWANETSAFMVIAQRDATQVNITIPSASGHVVDSFNAGSTFSVTLDKRRTVYVSQLVADENNAHVCGYRIVSSKPVSVISGNVNYDADHMVDQIPPVEKFGDHYVLAPAIPRDDTRSTKYIIQAINTGTTEVKFYTSSSPLNSTTYNISTAQNPPFILEVQSSSPGELTSDKPIFVTQVVANNPLKGVQHAMVVLPSIQQWSSTYVINSPMTSYSLGVVYHNSSNIYVSSSLMSPNIVKEVNGQGRYKFATILLPPQQVQVLRILSCDSPCLFIAYTWSNINDGAALVLPGTRYSNFDHCEPVGLRGDLMDNDCDGYIDEEIVDGVDNDKDELIDEDAIGHAKENLAAVAIRPINCKVSGDSTFNVFQQITGSNGCIIPDQPFLPAKNFTPVTGSNIGNGTETKILYSGVFEISMFIDKAQLFFMCDIGHYCLSALDTSCTTSICTPSKKRSVEDENLDNITVGVFVFPYNAQSSQWNISSGNTDTLSSLEVCMKNDAIILITTLPLALAALCCCLAVFVCMLYRKQVKQNATDAPKY